MRKSKKNDRHPAHAQPSRTGAPKSGEATDVPRERRWSTWSCAALVFAATWLTFRPALDGAWLDWDDAPLLTDIDTWRGLSLAHLRWMFSTFHMGPYQPLSWISYAIDHELGGMEPRGYHVTNVVLHAATAVALFFLARRVLALALSPTTARAARDAGVPDAWLELGAMLAALFWSIHPMRVESVAWITERRDCLSGLFFVLTLLVWLTHVGAEVPVKRGRWYWLAVACFAASLLAKGLGMVLPVVLLVLDVWPLRRFAQRDGRASTWLARGGVLVLEKWPFLLSSAGAAVLAVVGQRVAGAVLEAERHDASARIAQAFYGLAFYVRKTLWPSELMVLYPMSIPLDVGQPRFVASIAAVLVGVALLVTQRRRAPAPAVAFASYALIVAPVLGLMQTGSQLVADRYSYLSAMPLALLGAGALVLAARQLRARTANALIGFAALVIGAAGLAPLALATQEQIRVWHDTRSLWEHDLAIDPTSGLARRNLVASWMDQGKAESDPVKRDALLARAFEECRKGLAQKPDAVGMLNAAKICDLLAADDRERRQRYLELGLEYARGGIELVEKTLQRLPEVYESCAVILCELQRPGEAVPYLEQALRIDSKGATRHGLLGEALLQAGRAREAIAALETACRLAPETATLWLDLGDAHRTLGERDAALEAYGKVIALRRAQCGAQAPSDSAFVAATHAIESLAPHR